MSRKLSLLNYRGHPGEMGNENERNESTGNKMKENGNERPHAVIKIVKMAMWHFPGPKMKDAQGNFGTARRGRPPRIAQKCALLPEYAQNGKNGECGNAALPFSAHGNVSFSCPLFSFCGPFPPPHFISISPIFIPRETHRLGHRP